MVRSAFTLLELILLMAILSICVALAVPTLHGFAQGRRTVNCVEQIFAMLKYSHTQAISRGVTYRLNLDPASRTYWVTVQQDDGTYQSLNEEFGRVFDAPDGVTVTWDAPQRPDGIYLQFLPTGRTDQATIRVTDAAGRSTLITCDSPTEMFHIVSNQGGGR